MTSTKRLLLGNGASSHARWYPQPLLKTVSQARFVSLQLARFDMLRAICGLRDVGVSGMPFCSVAADTRGAGTEPVSQLAFVFLIFGLHENADSANQYVDARHEAAPWLRYALESWSAVLQ